MELRKVDKMLYTNYMKKAEESQGSAAHAFEKEWWDSCVSSSIHAVISASDALCVYFLGERAAGQRHLDAVQLLRKAAPNDAEVAGQIARFERLVGTKSGSEYSERLAKRAEAERALEDCERFMKWAKYKLERAVV